MVLLVEQKDVWCPALILDADTGDDGMDVVAFTGAPEIFSWQGMELLSLRIYYRGNGAQQKSLFFRLMGTQLVHLQQDSIGENAFPDAWKPSSHGGGFCRHSLRWEVTTWGGSPKQGLIRFQFKVDGRRLALESTALVPGGQPSEACDPYYELRNR